MELPSRAPGDRLVRPGEMIDLRRRVRRLASRCDDPSAVVVCAYDHRTRMLPFLYADMWMAPAGPVAIGSALADAGFHKTRIVLQQWSPRVRPSRMRLEGRLPELLLVSSLQIHSAPCEDLIGDACRIEPARRPLIVAGGAKVIYEPWSVFSADPHNPWGADVAVTGEEHVLLSLLEAVLSARGSGESLRDAFGRARDRGLLDGIPGLVYPLGPDGAPHELVDTGIQRMVDQLQELPHPALGLRRLEPPSGRATLSPRPLPSCEVRRHSPIASLAVMFGCRFSCPYCPIPAYNQRLHRIKSGAQVAEEMTRLHHEFGLGFFNLVGGNFFNDPARALEICEALARTELAGRPLHRRIRWGTEATVCDALKVKNHLPLVRQAGLHALWMGVEDMTGSLIRKGQSVDSTLELFEALREHDILPMPMMMHHDGQPLYTSGRPDGLLNQVSLLRKAGAIDVQVLMTTPAPGSRMYEPSFAAGRVYRSVAGRCVEPRHFSDMYVIASDHPQPWRKQLNVLAAYLYFFNPLHLLTAMVRPRGRPRYAEAGLQLLGMAGLWPTIRELLDWALRLRRGPIRRHTRPPAPAVPLRNADGGPASHALDSRAGV